MELTTNIPCFTQTKPIATIFGVTGQDGSYLAEFLLAKGYAVIGVARRVSVDTSERLKNVLQNKDFYLISGDITDAGSVFRILSEHKPAEVYNLAAQSHVKVSFDQPGLTWDITAKGCLNILEAIRQVDSKIKFYQASSSEMFGKEYDVDSFGQAYQNERTKMVPCSPYAIAKLAAHNFVKLYRDSYNIFACSGILFNHESPRRGENFVTRKVTKYVGTLKKKIDELRSQHGDYKDDDQIFSLAIEEIGKLTLGNIASSRDWGHSKDYVVGMHMMLQQEHPEDYVIGTEKTHTVRDLLNASFSVIGIIDWSIFVEFDKNFLRPSEVPFLKCDATKAKTYLKWKPSYSFKDLVKEMVEYDAGIQQD